MDNIIWSGTDFPYACLIDKKRTLTFQNAITEVVKPGDTVLDVGSGSGILSFFAAQAGAAKVYAVEIDHLLAQSLKSSIKQNSLEDIIEVIEGNVLELDLPKNVNVVIAELIETGLIEEMQVEVLNHLRKSGTINQQTKILPQSYDTFLQPVKLDNRFYGFHIAAPIHNWENYSITEEGWEQLKAEDLAEPQLLNRADFINGHVEPAVEKVLEFNLPVGSIVNAIKISSLAKLSDEVSLGATNTISGDKLLSVGPYQADGTIKLKVAYTMGGGLGRVEISRL